MLPSTPHRLAGIELARRAVMLNGEQARAPAIEPWITASWQRCLQRGQRPQHGVGFDVVSAAAMRRTADASHALRSAAREVLADLARVIAPTRYFSILTDARGVVVAAGDTPDADLAQVRAIARVGVDLSESSVGTTAICAALTEQRPVWLHRGEHFFEATSVYSCAGAPIFAPDNSCAGMLDLTGIQTEERPELRHLAAQMAERIEVNLLLALPHSRLLQLQWPGPWSSAGCGLIAVDGEGRIVGASRSACAMLGLRHESAARGFGTLEDSFATPAGRLMSLRPGQAPQPVPLWSGLMVCVAAGATGARPSVLELSAQTGTKLRDSQTALIRRSVDAEQGNVAAAARRLGISRATVYRHLARHRR